jgi:hypothetical protein
MSGAASDEADSERCVRGHAVNRSLGYTGMAHCHSTTVIVPRMPCAAWTTQMYS